MTRTGIALLLTGITLLYACAREAGTPEAAPESLRQTASGAVVGFADRHDTWSWRGIPFARPPVGELRWRAPRPPEPWEGTLQTLGFSDMCPQFPIPMVSKSREPWLGNEDCLYLNVSAPRAWSPGDEPLPVMVWLHGGGNTVGSADLYSAVRNLAAREDVVVVSIHYRLGILGWFSHPALREQADNELDASGNFGTLDTITALQWVRDNIRAFGGDPGNVTVFGESAGGMNTFALLLSPLAEGLFHQAASQSGILITVPLSAAEYTVDQPGGSPNSSTEVLLRLLQTDGSADNRDDAMRLLAGWDSAATMTYLRGKGPLELLEQMQGTVMGLYPAPNLLRDGVVLPTGDPREHLARGEFNRVPVILGTNRDEIKIMMLRDPDFTQPLFGVLPRVTDQALYDRVTGYGSSMWRATGADEPAAAMRAAGHGEIFVYRFDWDEAPSNWLIDFRKLMGAGHGLEIPFVFHDTDNELTYMPMDLIGGDNRGSAEALARAMSSYWGRFAHTGDPGRGSGGDLVPWPTWGAKSEYLVFDTEADGGIRTQRGAVDRDRVFRALANDQQGVGGQAGVCLAYTRLFGEEAIFGFAAWCPDNDSCAGSTENFCPADPG